MSYIDEQIRNHADYQNRYSIKEIENRIANLIFEDAKSMINFAIGSGKSSVTFVYNWESDGGYFEISLSTLSASEYLYNEYGGIVSMSQCFGPSYGNVRRKAKADSDYISGVRQNEMKLNLSAIEQQARSAILGLGVKNCELCVKYIDYYMKKIKKKKFFREYYEEEKKSVKRFKVYCRLSW